MSIGKKVERLLFSKKAITRTHAIAIVIILIVAIAAAYFATQLPTLGPGGGSNGNGSNGNGNGEPQLPDLKVSDINIYPSQPQAGIKFTAQVYVANIGEAKSGSYDLALKIVDVSNGYTYPIGTFRKDPMFPGEEYVVWSDQVMVNFEGSHQLYAEITPFLFEERDPYNNALELPFYVTP